MSNAFIPRREKGAITQVREQFKRAEDVRLTSHFAKWLRGVTGMEIHEDTLPEDLLDGIALCKLVMQIEGSNVVQYHHALNNAKMDAFKSRENCFQFQAACKQLGLPVTFGYDDLVNGDLGVIASTLVYLSHACALRNIGVNHMHDELKNRVGVVANDERATTSLQMMDRDELLEIFRDFHLVAASQLLHVKPESELEDMSTQDLLHELGMLDAARIALLGELKRDANAQQQQHLKALESLVLTDSIATAVREAAKPDYSCVGVDFRFLQALFSAAQTEGMTVNQVHKELIAPLLQQEQAYSLAAKLLRESDSNVALKADVVVILDPEIQWQCLLSALEETVETMDFVSQSGTTKVWLEQLCLQPCSQEVLETELSRVITSVGRVNIVISPFERPTCAMRSISVFQVACAVSNQKPVFASFPAKETARMLSEVYAGRVGLKYLQTMLWGINVELATNAQDMEQICRVRNCAREVDASKVNNAFTVPIRNWLLHQFKTAHVANANTVQESHLYTARAALHQCMGQFDEARALYERAIAVHRKIYNSENNVHTAALLGSMASTMRDLGDFQSAEQVCSRALEIHIELLGEDHASTIVTRAWLADILLASGAHERAIPVLERVMKDRERMQSCESDLLVAMNNLASAYREVGKVDEARRLFEQVLMRTAEVEGKESVLYGAALTNCALTLEAQKDYKTALDLHEKSLAVKIKALGAEHPEVALAMHNLGVCLLRNDKKANRTRAVEIGNKAIALWERTYGSKHPTVIEAKKDWARMQ